MKALSDLPRATRLRELLQANAALDAILMAEWEHRYFSFNSLWDESEEMGSLRDGQGTEAFCLFLHDVSFLKGFEPALELPNQGPLSSVEMALLPSNLQAAAKEPAFDMSHVSYVAFSPIARSEWTPVRPTEENWSVALSGMLVLLRDDPEAYTRWAEDYYERKVNQEIVESIQAGQSLTENMIQEPEPRKGYS